MPARSFTAVVSAVQFDPAPHQAGQHIGAARVVLERRRGTRRCVSTTVQHSDSSQRLYSRLTTTSGGEASLTPWTWAGEVLPTLCHVSDAGPFSSGIAKKVAHLSFQWREQANHHNPGEASLSADGDPVVRLPPAASSPFEPPGWRSADFEVDLAAAVRHFGDSADEAWARLQSTVHAAASPTASSSSSTQTQSAPSSVREDDEILDRLLRPIPLTFDVVAPSLPGSTSTDGPRLLGKLSVNLSVAPPPADTAEATGPRPATRALFLALQDMVVDAENESSRPPEPAAQRFPSVCDQRSRLAQDLMTAMTAFRKAEGAEAAEAAAAVLLPTLAVDAAVVRHAMNARGFRLVHDRAQRVVSSLASLNDAASTYVDGRASHQQLPRLAAQQATHEVTFNATPVTGEDLVGTSDAASLKDASSLGGAAVQPSAATTTTAGVAEWAEDVAKAVELMRALQPSSSIAPSQQLADASRVPASVKTTRRRQLQRSVAVIVREAVRVTIDVGQQLPIAVDIVRQAIATVTTLLRSSSGTLHTLATPGIVAATAVVEILASDALRDVLVADEHCRALIYVAFAQLQLLHTTIAAFAAVFEIATPPATAGAAASSSAAALSPGDVRVLGFLTSHLLSPPDGTVAAIERLRCELFLVLAHLRIAISSSSAQTTSSVFTRGASSTTASSGQLKALDDAFAAAGFKPQTALSSSGFEAPLPMPETLSRVLRELQRGATGPLRFLVKPPDRQLADSLEDQEDDGRCDIEEQEAAARTTLAAEIAGQRAGARKFDYAARLVGTLRRINRRRHAFAPFFTGSPDRSVLRQLSHFGYVPTPVMADVRLPDGTLERRSFASFASAWNATLGNVEYSLVPNPTTTTPSSANDESNDGDLAMATACRRLLIEAPAGGGKSSLVSWIASNHRSLRRQPSKGATSSSSRPTPRPPSTAGDGAANDDAVSIASGFSAFAADGRHAQLAAAVGGVSAHRIEAVVVIDLVLAAPLLAAVDRDRPELQLSLPPEDDPDWLDVLAPLITAPAFSPRLNAAPPSLGGARSVLEEFTDTARLASALREMRDRVLFVFDGLDEVTVATTAAAATAAGGDVPPTPSADVDGMQDVSASARQLRNVLSSSKALAVLLHRLNSETPHFGNIALLMRNAPTGSQAALFSRFDRVSLLPWDSTAVRRYVAGFPWPLPASEVEELGALQEGGSDAAATTASLGPLARVEALSAMPVPANGNFFAEEQQQNGDAAATAAPSPPVAAATEQQNPDDHDRRSVAEFISRRSAWLVPADSPDTVTSLGSYATRSTGRFRSARDVLPPAAIEVLRALDTEAFGAHRGHPLFVHLACCIAAAFTSQHQSINTVDLTPARCMAFVVSRTFELHEHMRVSQRLATPSAVATLNDDTVMAALATRKRAWTALLDAGRAGARTGVITMVPHDFGVLEPSGLLFMVRRPQRPGGPATYRFVHKSVAEYLAARRLVSPTTESDAAATSSSRAADFRRAVVAALRYRDSSVLHYAANIIADAVADVQEKQRAADAAAATAAGGSRFLPAFLKRGGRSKPDDAPNATDDAAPETQQPETIDSLLEAPADASMRLMTALLEQLSPRLMSAGGGGGATEASDDKMDEGPAEQDEDDDDNDYEPLPDDDGDDGANKVHPSFTDLLASTTVEERRQLCARAGIDLALSIVHVLGRSERELAARQKAPAKKADPTMKAFLKRLPGADWLSTLRFAPAMVSRATSSRKAWYMPLLLEAGARVGSAYTVRFAVYHAGLKAHVGLAGVEALGRGERGRPLLQYLSAYFRFTPTLDAAVTAANAEAIYVALSDATRRSKALPMATISLVTADLHRRGQLRALAAVYRWVATVPGDAIPPRQLASYVKALVPPSVVLPSDMSRSDAARKPMALRSAIRATWLPSELNDDCRVLLVARAIGSLAAMKTDLDRVALEGWDELVALLIAATADVDLGVLAILPVLRRMASSGTALSKARALESVVDNLGSDVLDLLPIDTVAAEFVTFLQDHDSTAAKTKQQQKGGGGGAVTSSSSPEAASYVAYRIDGVVSALLAMAERFASNPTATDALSPLPSEPNTPVLVHHVTQLRAAVDHTASVMLLAASFAPVFWRAVLLCEDDPATLTDLLAELFVRAPQHSSPSTSAQHAVRVATMVGALAHHDTDRGTAESTGAFLKEASIPLGWLTESIAFGAPQAPSALDALVRAAARIIEASDEHAMACALLWLGGLVRRSWPSPLVVLPPIATPAAALEVARRTLEGFEASNRGAAGAGPVGVVSDFERRRRRAAPTALEKAVASSAGGVGAATIATGARGSSSAARVRLTLSRPEALRALEVFTRRSVTIGSPSLDAVGDWQGSELLEALVVRCGVPSLAKDSPSLLGAVNAPPPSLLADFTGSARGGARGESPARDRARQQQRQKTADQREQSRLHGMWNHTAVVAAVARLQQAIASAPPTGADGESAKAPDEQAAATAKHALSLAADGGCTQAQYTLGLDHYNAAVTARRKGDTGKAAEHGEEAHRLLLAAAQLWHREAQYVLGLCLAFGFGPRGGNNIRGTGGASPPRHRDPSVGPDVASEANHWFRLAALQQHADAAMRLGLTSAGGRSTQQQSPVETARAFRQAAELGHAEGQYRFAMCLRDGVGVSRHSSRATLWALRAAEQHYPDAMFALGSGAFTYPLQAFTGSSLSAADHVLSLASAATRRAQRDPNTWLAAAGEAGCAPAFVTLGERHLAGSHGIQRDGLAAAALFRKAADLKSPEGALWLGRCLAEGISCRQGVPDKEAARAQFEIAAKGGSADGAYEFGTLLVESIAQLDRERADTTAGQSAPATNSRDEPNAAVSRNSLVSQAEYWLRAAAALGHVRAQLQLGRFLVSAKAAPSASDMAEASHLVKAAADAGEPEALSELGLAYLDGRIGLERAPARAVPLLRRAAAANVAAACVGLGRCYESGLGGCSRNADEARRWMQRAREADRRGRKVDAPATSSV